MHVQTKIIISTLVLLGLMTAINHRAYAQQGVEVSVSPPLTVLEATSSAVLRTQLVVENTSLSELSITPTVHPFSADGKTGTPILELDVPIPEVAIENPELTLGQPFLLPKNGKRTVTLVITPKQPLRQDLTFTLLFASQNANATLDSGASVTAAVGANIIIKATPGYEGNGELIIESLDTLSIGDISTSISPTILVHNSLASFVRIRGIAQIRDGRSEVVETIALFPDLILAESSRSLRGTKKTDSSGVEGQPLHFAPINRVGRYELEIDIVTNDGKTAKLTTSFYLLPLRILGVSMAGLAALFVIILTLSNSRKRQNL